MSSAEGPQNSFQTTRMQDSHFEFALWKCSPYPNQCLSTQMPLHPYRSSAMRAIQTT